MRRILFPSVAILLALSAGAADSHAQGKSKMAVKDSETRIEVLEISQLELSAEDRRLLRRSPEAVIRRLLEEHGHKPREVRVSEGVIEALLAQEVGFQPQDRETLSGPDAGITHPAVVAYKDIRLMHVVYPPRERCMYILVDVSSSLSR